MANVPIVTEVTKSQLDALVVANGLNEGLQYKVTDKNQLLIATSNNTYKTAAIPYKTYAAIVTRNGALLTVTELCNEIGEIVWSFYGDLDEEIHGTLNGAFTYGKTVVSPRVIAADFQAINNSEYVIAEGMSNNDVVRIAGFIEGEQRPVTLLNIPIEIRVYEF